MRTVAENAGLVREEPDSAIAQFQRRVAVAFHNVDAGERLGALARVRRNVDRLLNERGRFVRGGLFANRIERDLPDLAAHADVIALPVRMEAVAEENYVQVHIRINPVGRARKPAVTDRGGAHENGAVDGIRRTLIPAAGTDTARNRNRFGHLLERRFRHDLNRMFRIVGGRIRAVPDEH